MPRKSKYAKLTRPELAELIAARQSDGQSLRAIARELGVSLKTVQDWRAEPAGDASQVGPRPTAADGGVPPTEERMTEEQERAIEERVRLRDAVAGLTATVKTQGEVLSKLGERLEGMTRQPLRVERHDGELNVSCPSCGTRATVPQEFDAERFEDVLAQFNKPHKRSPDGSVFQCPDCAPKLSAMLKEKGYALSRITSARH